HVVIDHQDGRLRFRRGRGAPPAPRLLRGGRWLPHAPLCAHDTVSFFARAACRVTVNVLPPPGPRATRGRPSFFSRRARAIARPSPSPRAFVEYSGSMTWRIRSGGMPPPVSPTAPSPPPPAWLAVIVSRPPPGIASRAFRT